MYHVTYEEHSERRQVVLTFNFFLEKTPISGPQDLTVSPVLFLTRVH